MSDKYKISNIVHCPDGDGRWWISFVLAEHIPNIGSTVYLRILTVTERKEFIKQKLADLGIERYTLFEQGILVYSETDLNLFLLAHS